MICIIVQARMGATRLPGKMMKDIAGKPAIAHVFERARLSKRARDVWLATTTNAADDVLAGWAARNRVPCYRGSERDVLDRYYQTAKEAGAGVIVRITGDCPLLDAAVIDEVIDGFAGGMYDYVSNVHPPTFPDGLDTEVFSFAALERAWREAKLPSEREHVTPYMWKNPDLFAQKNVEQSPDASAHRWTLDTPADLQFLRLVAGECTRRGSQCGWKEVLAILEAHREWQTINASFSRNEGYKKSLDEDRIKTDRDI